ncbi:helix-turn-helix domain-containing protein [Paenibacillus sp. CAU 1782]
MEGYRAVSDYTFYLPVAVHQLTGDNLSLMAEYEWGSNQVIIIVTDGWSRILLGGTEQKLVRSSVLCCDRYQHLRWLEAKSFRAIAIEYLAMRLDGRPPSPAAMPFLPLAGSQEMMMLGQQLETAWKERMGKPLNPQRLLLELLTRLHEECQAGGTPNVVPWLSRVLDLLHRRCFEEWTRESLADYVGVSPEHFSRVFRKETGSTFTLYHNLLRIREAQLRLMMGQAHNLHELARQVGYKDSYYFSKKFKSIIGLAPSLYMRKPRRIVSSNYNYTEMLMELGVAPVLGAYASWSRHRKSAGENEEWELNWSAGRGTYEQLEQCKPDVILGYELLAEDKRLYRYGAVAAIPLLTLSWREQFRIIADIADCRERAEERLNHYDQKAAEANDKLDNQGIARGTATVWEIYSDVAYVFDESYGRGAQVLYGDLGFQKPAELIQQGLEKKGFLGFPISAVADFDCDYLFIVAMKDSMDARQLFRSPAWGRLQAALRGRVYIINDFERFYGYDPGSTELQLQHLLDCLIS